MNNYIVINSGTPKWLRVVMAGYEAGKLTPQEITRSLTSKAAKQYATGYRYWQMVARLKYTESGSYASLTDVLGWETATAITLTDFFGATYNVVLANGGDIRQQQQIPIFDSAESFSYISLRFEETL